MVKDNNQLASMLATESVIASQCLTASRSVTFMNIFIAIILTVLPGSWLVYGLRITGIPAMARLAIAVALSPIVVGLQLAVLEAIGIPFALSAYTLVFLNLPCLILLIRRYRKEGGASDLRTWLSIAPLLVMIVVIPIAGWYLIPNMRAYQWETMLHSDVVYTVARDGVYVEEANLAGVSLAYGWIGHSYWSVISWIGQWAPTKVYPVTNVVWIIVTFILGYHLGKTGLGLYKTTALLGVTLLFMGTNLIGMVLLLFTGYSPWWDRYFGDIRYSPYLGKFYGFDTMIWGMSLLLALALVYTIALKKRVTPLDGLTVILLTGLGLVYPVLFPAGLVLAGCFIFLIITRLPNELPQYTRAEIARLGLGIILSSIAVWFYLGLVTADRAVGIFALSGRSDIQFKTVRFLGAMGPFLVMAALPFLGFIRRRYGPALLLALSTLTFSAVYVGIDLTQLEYKYVLAGTICLVFLATAVLDSPFKRNPRLGWVTVYIVSIGLVLITLLLLFNAPFYVPGNVDQGLPLDESSFWIALDPGEPDSKWINIIREETPKNTVVIARKPGVKLSVLVDRSMYIPSDTDGGRLPGYNLNQRFYLVQQRGYSADLYDQRLDVVKTIYTSKSEEAIIDALHDLKELRRPLAIYFPSRDNYSLKWLEKHGLGRALTSDDQNVVWLVDDPSILP